MVGFVPFPAFFTRLRGKCPNGLVLPTRGLGHSTVKMRNLYIKLSGRNFLLCIGLLAYPCRNVLAMAWMGPRWARATSKIEHLAQHWVPELDRVVVRGGLILVHFWGPICRPLSGHGSAFGKLCPFLVSKRAHFWSPFWSLFVPSGCFFMSPTLAFECSRGVLFYC